MNNSIDEVRDQIFQFCESKQYSAAREFFNVKLGEGILNASNAEHLLWQSSIEGLSGNLQLAKQLLCLARKYDPNCSAVLFALARSFMKLNQFGDCAQALVKLLEIEKRSNESYFSESAQFYLAVAYLNLKDKNNFYREVSSVDGAYSEWRNGKLYSKKMMLEEAGHTFGEFGQ